MIDFSVQALRVLRASVVASVLVLFAAPGFAAPVAAAADPFGQADAGYAKRFQAGENDKMIAMLDEALKADPKAYGALWRRARTEKFKGDRAEQPKKIEIYTRAKELAEQAVAADPSRWEGHYWLGVSLGKWGVANGILKSLSMAKPMRNELEKAIELNPGVPGPHYALAILYRMVPGMISIGDKKKGLQHAQAAVDLDANDTGYQ